VAPSSFQGSTGQGLCSYCTFYLKQQHHYLAALLELHDDHSAESIIRSMMHFLLLISTYSDVKDFFFHFRLVVCKLSEITFQIYYSLSGNVSAMIEAMLTAAQCMSQLR
jgi:hypothetical protein